MSKNSIIAFDGVPSFGLDANTPAEAGAWLAELFGGGGAPSTPSGASAPGATTRTSTFPWTTVIFAAGVVGIGYAVLKPVAQRKGYVRNKRRSSQDCDW